MLLVVTPIIKSMASSRIYSPNSRLTKFRHACNLNTEFYANRTLLCDSLLIRTSADVSTAKDVGYIYYDTDSNTSSGFIFVTRFDYCNQVQELKSYFSKCIRLFRIKTKHDWTYYRVDATRILHADNTGRAKE